MDIMVTIRNVVILLNRLERVQYVSIILCVCVCVCVCVGVTVHAYYSLLCIGTDLTPILLPSTKASPRPHNTG